LCHQLLKRSSFEDSPEFRFLRRVLRRIAPLTLRDPQSAAFTASRCRTYHDVIRFAHEKAIAELTHVGWVRMSGEQPHMGRLDLAIPLDLILIDLGGGFHHRSGTARASLDDVASRPLRPLLEALTADGIWETAPADMDTDGFMSSATRSMALTSPLAGRPTQNLAIVSGEYLHLSLRLGYHFNIVDAHLGDTVADNYIYFRFAGGVTELTRRSRRAALLKQILEDNGFVTEGREDLVIGRVKGLPPDIMADRMSMIGRLIGFTRQLDVFLRSDGLVDEYVERFLGRGPEADDSPQAAPATETSMNRVAEVLVLDDEPMVCDRLKEHLDGKGYDVEVFTDSQKAIDRLSGKRFDVVVTDLKMAGPSGLDVLRFVRDQNYGSQVIMITGYGSFEDARKAEYTGAYEFVSKPFSVKALEKTIRAAARKARKQDQGERK
jgi:CheY-like chemotaxis protein